MASAVIGALRVVLSADSAEFKRGLTSAEKLANRFGRAVGTNLRNQLMGLGAAAAVAAGPAALGLLVASSVENISAQVDLAKRVGATVAAIQALSYQTEQSGGSTEALTKALGMMNVKLDEAAREGAGPAYEALERLGLSAREISKLDADEKIKAISDRMAELGLTTQAQAGILRGLGVKQQELINLFQEGSGAIDEARKKLADWGVLLSDVDAGKVEAAGDAWDKIKTIMAGLGNQLAVQVAPAIVKLADAFDKAVTEAGGWDDIVNVAIEKSIALFVGLNRELYDVQRTIYFVGSALVDLKNSAAEFERSKIGKTIADGFEGAILGVGGAGLASKVGQRLVDGARSGFEKVEQVSRTYFFQPTENNYAKLLEAMGKPPSYEDWLAYWQQMQHDMNSVLGGGTDKPSGDGGGVSDAQVKEQERFQEMLAQRLVTLQESLMTEREAELAAYDQRQLDLETAHAQGLLSDQEYRDHLIRNHQQHAEAMSRINDGIARDAEQNIQRQLNAYNQLAGDIGTVLDSVFGESKFTAIAQAIINTAQAVTRNLAEYPGPLGFAMAAAAAAAGLAQIATIRSTSNKGGGGGGGRASVPSSVPTSSGSSSSDRPQAPSLSQTLYLRGMAASELYSGESVRAIVAQLIEYQRDGGKIVLAET